MFLHFQAHDGFGCDRHFLGLKNIALENGIKLPELYSDPTFIRTSQLRFAASQVSMNCEGIMCYSPQEDEYFACCYNPRPDDIYFSFMAYAQCPRNSVKDFKKLVEKSLTEMHDLLLK